MKHQIDNIWIGQKDLENDKDFIAESNLEAVSYTHLDVYKRQMDG